MFLFYYAEINETSTQWQLTRRQHVKWKMYILEKEEQPKTSPVAEHWQQLYQQLMDDCGENHFLPAGLQTVSNALTVDTEWQL